MQKNNIKFNDEQFSGGELLLGYFSGENLPGAILWKAIFQAIC